jgi:hypothetical protein
VNLRLPEASIKVPIQAPMTAREVVPKEQAVLERSPLIPLTNRRMTPQIMYYPNQEPKQTVSRMRSPSQNIYFSPAMRPSSALINPKHNPSLVFTSPQPRQSQDYMTSTQSQASSFKPNDTKRNKEWYYSSKLRESPVEAITQV